MGDCPVRSAAALLALTATTVSPCRAQALEHGFRYDPIEWLRTSSDLDAVRLRTLILQDPLAGDSAVLDAEIAKILAEQQPDGHIGAPNVENPIAETGGELWRLLGLGCPTDRLELQAAAGRVCLDLADADSDDIGFYTLAALCQADKHDDPAVRRLVLEQRGWLVDYDAANAFGPGVARTPNVKLMRMWYCRDVGGLEEALEQWLKWIEERLEPTICGRDVGLFLLWDAFEIFGEVEHPVAERVAPKLVPIVLRHQQPDGTWGGRFSYLVYRFLIKHDLLDTLTDLPPLPPDWEVVRDVPVPCEEPFSIGWDGEFLWVQDKKAHSAIAVSPDDGGIERTVLLPGEPDGAVLGIWDGCLALAVSDPVRKLYKVDAVSGEVLLEVPFRPGNVLGVAQLGDKVVLADHWDGHMWETPSDQPGEWTPWRSAAGMPNFLSAFGDELWVSDGLCPLIIKTNRAGDLLDWGEKPFGWGGIAWTGEDLWALDREGGRVCVIEKTW